MTISYSLDVSKAQFCGFTKLLARWKGGIYKILWREFLVFCIAYAALSIVYRNYLNAEQKMIFEQLVIFVDSCTDMIPLSFVLGFYVSLVIGRWWGQYETIPWPDRICFLIASYVHGSDERSRMIRRTLGRYVILVQALTFQAVSTSVKRRFPTTNHLVTAGIMTPEEKCVYDKVYFKHGKWWLPCQWFSALATRAHREGRIKDSILLNGLLNEVLSYRTNCAIMFGYDWISVPLVYTQVVTIATYMYSLSLIVGRQFLDPSKGLPHNAIDLYVPFFTLLQFFFYVGWLKVAEQILNPYGEDDDDFELNWCLDRTVHLVYLVVDNLQLKHPRMSKDRFWDEKDPVLPQTKHSSKIFTQPQLGSASSLNIEDAEYLPIDAFLEQDSEDNMYKSSVKRANERPSLIRRMLSRGFSHHSSKKSAEKVNSGSSLTPSQGFSNPAFDANNEEKSMVPNFPLTSSNPMLNNSVSSNNTFRNKTTSVSFRPNSLSLHKKTYDLRDAEERMYHSQQGSPNIELSPISNTIPVSRTISAPPAANVQNIENDRRATNFDEGDDCLEIDVDDVVTEDKMPVILEEYSRSASMASIEAGVLNVASSLATLQNRTVVETQDESLEPDSGEAKIEPQIQITPEANPTNAPITNNDAAFLKMAREFDVQPQTNDIESDDCLEPDSEDLFNTQMPIILEESSRSASIANCGDGLVKSSESLGAKSELINDEEQDRCLKHTTVDTKILMIPEKSLRSDSIRSIDASLLDIANSLNAQLKSSIVVQEADAEDKYAAEETFSKYAEDKSDSHISVLLEGTSTSPALFKNNSSKPKLKLTSSKLKRLQEVHDLVLEASEAIKELNRSLSMEHEGIEDDDFGSPLKLDGTNDVNLIGEDTPDKVKAGDTVIIDIENSNVSKNVNK